MTDWIELGLKENGFFWYFKEGTKHHEKAMICMSGADGSKEFALLSGQEIWDMGYSVLVLGFIKWEGLPKETYLIPVEYVENMKADVLLLASENDDCWPSEVSARRVDAILRNVEYPYRVKSVIYEKGSHAIGGMLNDEKMRKRMKKILPAEKKYPAECEEARVDSMKQIEAFLAEW